MHCQILHVQSSASSIVNRELCKVQSTGERSITVLGISSVRPDDRMRNITYSLHERPTACECIGVTQPCLSGKLHTSCVYSLP